ncbi:hypothetical protein [Azospirillum griseum]|uniref:Uncharacterized protein n=1 Tax=Azospirillum griseum TaxID=2496639 RepID=A0A3S0K7V2_9PROT|nr:hypothetical protein [Azospirillum griseum]RTR15683.1 hypothetical protein EJ903_22620 [Azospirillum griseum]
MAYGIKPIRATARHSQYLFGAKLQILLSLYKVYIHRFEIEYERISFCIDGNGMGATPWWNQCVQPRLCHWVGKRSRLAWKDFLRRAEPGQR